MENDHREVICQLNSDQNQIQQKEIVPLDKHTFKQQVEHDLMSAQLLQSGIDGFIKAREQLNTLLRQSFGLDAEIKA